MIELTEEIKEFNEKRECNQFHSLKKLAKSIFIEASKLLEGFQQNDKYDKNLKEKVQNIISFMGENNGK